MAGPLGGGRGISRFKLSIPLSYKRIFRIGGGEEEKEGVTKEIGLRDLIFETMQKVEVGNRLELDFKLPNGHRIKVEGRVTGVIEGKEEGEPYRVEVQLINLSRKDALAINMVGYRLWLQQESKSPYMETMRTPYEPTPSEEEK